MDPSSSSESQVFVNDNKPEQNQGIIFMDRDSYNAATKGEIEVFKNIADHKSLALLVTANKNTILHIYITALNSQFESRTPIARSESTTTLNTGSESTTNFVEVILEMCSPLLWKANVKGETPLHIAARYGHDDIVKVLIKYCAQTPHQDLEGGIEPIKQMLRMTNKEKNTALHEAVRYHHLKVVTLLIETDPNFSYFANDVDDETPLYIAAERGLKDVLFEILDKCESPMLGVGGPLGRTALHAAVIWGDKYEDMITRILKKVEGISRTVDNEDWTPLHLAAYLGHSALATLLLNDDKYVAYMKDKNGRTALHIAAQRGNDDIVKSIVSSCPDCCELVDNKGWNVLHFAINCLVHKFFFFPRGKNKCLERIIEIIRENSCLDNLLNEKNADGDAPLHYYLKEGFSAKNFFGHPRLDKMAFNEKNLTAFEGASSYFQFFKTKEGKKISLAKGRPPLRVITYKDNTREPADKELPSLRSAAKAHLIVAALITTVTFAACINVPGGFVQSGKDLGSALLRKNVAFKAFIIMDALSMALSSCAVFIHLLIPIFFTKYVGDEQNRLRVILIAYYLICMAFTAMVLAFSMGAYAVLASFDLDFAVWIINSLIIPAILFLVSKIFGLFK